MWTTEQIAQLIRMRAKERAGPSLAFIRAQGDSYYGFSSCSALPSVSVDPDILEEAERRASCIGVDHLALGKQSGDIRSSTFDYETIRDRFDSLDVFDKTIYNLRFATKR